MIKSHVWDFNLGVEFPDKTVDGRSVLVRPIFDNSGITYGACN